MRAKFLICSALMAISVPAAAQAPAATGAVAESALANSSVSIAVEPALNDGRLVIKIAAQNRSKAAIPFGPASVSVAKPDGEAIALRPLDRLIDDVRVAAGLAPVQVQGTTGAYAAPIMPVNSEGQVDVSGYTGGMAVAPDENIRRVRSRTKAKGSISAEDADRQIATLNAAILKDSTVQPGQVAAGQVVSEPLKFAKDEDRTLHLRIRIAGDEHGFTIAAPKK